MHWWSIVALAGVVALAAFVLLRTQWLRLRRERELLELYRSLKEISSSPDVKTVLTTVAAHAAQAIGAKDAVVMIRSGEDLRTFSGIDADVQPIANVLGRQAFEQEPPLPSVVVMRTGQPLLIDDVRDHAGPPGFQDACEAAGVRSVLCAPIRASSGVAGCLNLAFDRPNAFGPREERLATAYAEQAALGLERAIVYELEQEAMQKLQELDALRTDFVSAVSHEIHTPLTSICGFSELLTETWDELVDEDRQEFLGRIAAQAKQLAGLVDDLLDVGRLDAGAIGTAEPLHLRMLVRSVLELLNEELQRHRIHVDIPARTVVNANAAGCERILFNLLTNAAKYSPPGSLIAIRAVTADGEVTMSVCDEGIGIAADEQEKIFERFYRAQRGDAGPRGTGLGLPIAKRYAEAMGRRIWVTSEPGAGSTFSFTLELGDHVVEAAAV